MDGPRQSLWFFLLIRNIQKKQSEVKHHQTNKQTNFNAVFLQQSVNLYELLMGDNKYFVFCIFERYIEFLFFIQFWYVFCCWMKCVTCFQKYVDSFFNLLLNNTHYFFTEVLLYWVTIEHQILCKNECNNLSLNVDFIEHWTQTYIWIIRWVIQTQVSL